MVALNKLIKLGLINEDDSIYMHDVLKDVIDAANDALYALGTFSFFYPFTDELDEDCMR